MADTDADGFEVIGVTPATVLKGGTLSAGGGLLLQVRSAVQRLSDGQVLEVQSAEPAVKEELAAWSRLTGNQMLADLDAGVVNIVHVLWPQTCSSSSRCVTTLPALSISRTSSLYSVGVRCTRSPWI